MQGTNLPKLSVDEVTNRIQGLFFSDPVLQNLIVVGEIVEIKKHTSGHVYFTLSGDEGRLSCVLFKNDAARVPEWPRKGDEVWAEGRVGVYPPRGSYQLYVRRLTPQGIGAAARAREELRLRLDKEGLFDPRLKRKLPAYPQKVAVITSSTGAAIKDVLKVSRNRFPQCSIVIVPCLVQGYDAPEEIFSAFVQIRPLIDVDAVMLVRGGGSRDDLNPFDDERVIRAIRSCPVPVITGVGHETDTTLSDLAADVAASTPSAAAERLFPDHIDLIRHVDFFSSSLSRTMQTDIRKKKDNLAHFQQLIFTHSSRMVERGAKILQENKRHMDLLMKTLLEGRKQALSSVAGALNALSPLSILGRGFISCTKEEGEVVTSVDQLEIREKLILSFIDGRSNVRVEKITKTGEKDEDHAALSGLLE